jgi:adenylate cyclase
VAHPDLNVEPLVDWLEAGALPVDRPQDVLRGVGLRLVELGVAVYRIGVFVRTLHPNVLGRAFVWQADRDLVEMSEAGHDLLESQVFVRSPIRIVFAEHAEVRRRLVDPACPLDFPILEDLTKEGASDFLAVPLRFVSGEVHAASFATRRPGGFSEGDLHALRRLLPPFTRVAEIYANMRKAQNILDAYLGPGAGAKVLAGQIKRGDAQDIDAVIWFCDLRDSTPLADSMSRRDFLRLLNDYFECVLGPVLERQGEVLRFIGDAALAIFPVEAHPAAACAKALEAAREALARLRKFSENRESPLRVGIGLHLGSLTYGNVGTPSRIEFTVVGAAANEAARIESLCKDLRVDLLASERVARALGQEMRGHLVSLGSYTLRGLGDKMELFTFAR